jgi:hypothetical protein
MGWRPVNCYHRRHQGHPLEVGQTKVPIFFAVEGYQWEGNGFDCSINDGVTADAPSAYLRLQGGLAWDGTQVSWNFGSEPVFAYVGRKGFHENRFVAVKGRWFLSFLADRGLALVVMARGERRHLASDATHRQPWLEFASVVALNAKGKLTGKREQVKLHPGHPDPATSKTVVKPASNSAVATPPQLEPVQSPVAEETSDTVLYFAYGSNMATARLEKRVGTVSQRGVGTLVAHRITFDKISQDGTGKTNVRPNKSSVVWGVLFQLSNAQLRKLEGLETGYVPLSVTINQIAGDISAVTFVAKKHTPGLRPTRRYREFLISGAREHGLPADYVNRLKAVKLDEDLAPK